ncbi:helix-turn-helix domain-containing protein [Nocardioides sp. GY 10127]|uniref:ArsR/SmtB family transcription factor n=1 Tax=Nocardioides sp. GY 10127 TaxID=2569762 RepID=UPI0010A79C9D|nr:helix-turn-helix domain-containing protein [Nocardioides sp. GY 10127]TIC81588.1 helix-turn-helix transcriptional regulator [Nocardioides sp. GY 10127]
MDERESSRKVAVLRALAHPVRLRMLSLLTGTAMSAAEVARELDLTHANASYHLRVLADAGELVVDGEEKIRGGVAKRYRYPHEREGHPPEGEPTADHGPGGSLGDPDVGRHEEVLFLRATATDLERRVLAAAPRRWSSDLEGWVPPETWERAQELLREASRLLHDANRPPRTPGTVHVSATAWAMTLDAHDGPSADRPADPPADPSEERA